MLDPVRATRAGLLVALANSSWGQTEDPAALAREHESAAFVSIAAPCLTPDLLAREITRLSARQPETVSVETIGASFHGQPIRMLSIGRGPKSILLWSQMHGDEPSATPALLDVADFLARHRDRPAIARILDTFTLRMIPMLNPDGALRYERRNAQGIDINRDALMLATPEGRLLKSIRERFSPILGFNLHDQGRRVIVGHTGVLSTISLLAVAGDAQGTMTPGRERARRAASRVVLALSPFIPGGIARYDEDWNPRAFGDNITAWGTPVVLIESGAFPKGGGFKELTRLNFVALLTVLDGLAANDLSDISPDSYDRLLRNRADAFADVVVRGASILEPKTGRWFEGDLAFDLLASDQTTAGCGQAARTGSRVIELGDSSALTAGRAVDGRGLLVAPLSPDFHLKPGDIALADLLALRPGATPASHEPKDVLSALRLSEDALARNGRVSLLAWIPAGLGAGGGRYVAVEDGRGADSAFR